MVSEPIQNLKSKIQNLRRLFSLQGFRHRRGRLVRHYFLISLLLIAGGLISSAVLEIYFRYRESQEYIARLEREAAAVAVVKIERFVQDIATAIRAATKSREAAQSDISPEYRFELKRLLYLTPAITEAVALDTSGAKQAHVSRAGAVSANTSPDFSASPGFQRALQGVPDYGPVYFVQNSEPYMTIAFPIEQFAGTVIGVLRAEVNLKHVWDVVSSIKAGKDGYAYVVSRTGDLISHRDISLVLQRRNLGHLDQVKAAFQAASGPQRDVTLATNLDGKKVISSHAFIPSLQWVVIIERPAEEAYAPLRASMLRTASLLLVAFTMALVASFFMRQRVVRPLEALRRGVERIGKGDLNHSLDLKTGDEIEILADEFNEMATHLRKAYTELERKVAERTQALTIANQKLAGASELKSQFLANVNHELRTPVSAIIGYGGLVLSDAEGRISPLQKENLKDLLNNAERLLSLIDGLLDITKIEAGKLEVRIEPVDLEEIVRSAISTIESTVDKNHVQIIRNTAPNLPVLNTDRDKLKQILLNLLDNAAKFTERGEIRISAARQNGSLKLVVSDTGIGIPEQDLDKVFEEFHRVGATNGKKYRGTGLGLAIVKRLVNLLGGRIEVSSKVGEGSSFTVSLPLDYHSIGAL